MFFYKVVTLLTLIALTAVGCCDSKIDKKSYTDDTSHKAFSHSMDLDRQSENIHVLGRSFFTIPWVEAPSATTARDGLGPLFSANSCKHCHPNDGAGLATDATGKISRSLVMRLSISNTRNINNGLKMKNGFISEPTYGAQLSINGTSDTPYEGVNNVAYKTIQGKYADGTLYELQEPSYSITDLQYGEFAEGVNIAPHIALALIGLGKIEAIKQRDILKNEDIEDRDGDGISGKANWVYSPETNRSELGRFTWKAAAASVKHQTANAAHNDMGLTNPLYPKENCTQREKECNEAIKGAYEFDLPESRLDAIAFYLQTLKIPAQRKHKNFTKGEQIFQTLSCNKCHRESYTIANNELIKPYSDFLLHDMGDRLSDGHTIFKATVNEFRTPPLWGLGLYKEVSGGVALLHDGRARDIEEAILWHGGEAVVSKEAFKALPKQDRQYLLDFLGAI